MLIRAVFLLRKEEWIRWHKSAQRCGDQTDGATCGRTEGRVPGGMGTWREKVKASSHICLYSTSLASGFWFLSRVVSRGPSGWDPSVFAYLFSKEKSLPTPSPTSLVDLGNCLSGGDPSKWANLEVRKLRLSQQAICFQKVFLQQLGNIPSDDTNHIFRTLSVLSLLCPQCHIVGTL